MSTLADFNELINSLTTILKELSKTEETKFNAVKNNDFTMLDFCIKEEQAQVLKLRGLDRKREQLQESLGYKDLTFSEIIELFPKSESAQSRKLFEELKTATTEFNEINSIAKTAIEVNLHSVNSIIEDLKTNNSKSKHINPPKGGGLANKFV